MTAQATNTIIHGDCLAVMRTMPDQSVDLVFDSPPYSDARTYGIAFKLKGQAWVDWMVELTVEALRVCRGPVCTVIEARTEDFSWGAEPAMLMADLVRRGVTLRKPPIFHRVGVPGSGGPDWLRNDYEFIVCCTNGGKLPWSDNTAMGHPPKWAPGGEMSNRLMDGQRVNERDQWGGTGHASSGEGRKTNGEFKTRRIKATATMEERARLGPHRARQQAAKRTKAEKLALGAKLHTKHDTEAEMREQAYLPPAMANPGNTIQQTYTADEVSELLAQASDVTHHLVGGGVMGSRLCHENEAPYPESLPEFFIRSFCPPGGIVLDRFCGSGTTAAVAHRLGRKYITIDVRESQVKLAKRRLANATPPLIPEFA